MSRFWGILLIVLAVAWPASALADKRVALVFSAERYEHLRVLQNPGNDAGKVGEALEKLGFEVSPESNRNLKRMRQALENFAEDAKDADVALVYFAGHGVEIGGQNYLLPIDADPASLDALTATALPLNELREAAASVAKSVLIVLDACRNDPFGNDVADGRSMKAFGGKQRPEIIKPGLGRIGMAENTLFAFSAAPGQTAADGDGGNSPFSAALANYLGTDGLEIRSVLTLVQQEVYEKSGGKQLPYVESGLPTLFFASQTGPLPERETLLLAMADVTPDMRAEVERVAAQNTMPLAPLYGALISADLKAMTQDDRSKKLMEAALAFTKTRDELKALSSTDPQVTKLRDEANTALGLGAFARANNALEAAAKLDATSGDTLVANLVTRRLSEAGTHQARAGVAMAQLDYGGAIAAYEQAAALHEKVEKEDVPDAERSNRTWLLADLGDLQVQAGNTTAARLVFERMEISAKVRLAHSVNNPDAQRDLSASFNKIGDVRSSQGDLTGALKAYQDQLAVAEKLAAQDPGNAGWQRDLSVSFNNIGDVRRSQGDLTGALKAYQDGLAVREKLTAQDSGNAGWQRDLSVSFDRVGDVRLSQGDLTGALKAYQDGLAVREKLAVRDPGNAGWQRNLSVSFTKIGDVRLSQGDLTGALKAYQDGLAIAEKLAAQDPGNAEWQRDLSVSFERIGDVRRSQGDLTGALKAYQDGLAVREKLAAQDPGNAEWQRDLSVSFERIGNVRRSQGDLTRALKAYQAALAVREKLAAQDPGNAEWQGDLSISFSKIGDVRRSQGDLPGALKAYQDGLAISEKLAAQDPGNAQWQRGLIISNVKLAEVGDIPVERYQAALAVGRSLEASGRLAPADAWMIPELEKLLAAARNQ